MQVYVRLVGEGVDVWRPVSAEPIASDSVQLSPQHDDRDIEVLEFLPGQLVRCAERSFADGQIGRAAIEQVERPGLRQPFLACYDYGQGGIWVIIRAESAVSIRATYPELDVIPRVPEWMTPEALASIQDRNSYDLAAQPAGFLATLVKERTPA